MIPFLLFLTLSLHVDVGTSYGTVINPYEGWWVQGITPYITVSRGNFYATVNTVRTPSDAGRSLLLGWEKGKGSLTFGASLGWYTYPKYFPRERIWDVSLNWRIR